jgi:hypothetical protein
MVLTSILLTLGSTVLLGGRTATESTATNRQALDASAATTNQMRADVSTAAAPDRYDIARIGSATELSGALGITPSTNLPPAAASAVVHDVVSLTSTSLWIRTDAVPDSADGDAVECVGWYAAEDGGIVREVREDWRGCTGEGTVEQIIDADLVGNSQPLRISAATLISTASTTGGSGGGKGGGKGGAKSTTTTPTAATGTCTQSEFSTYATSPPPADLARIVAIRIELSTSSQRVQSVVDLRNRSTSMYLEAIGCGS